jgi:hypothetical protein
VVRRGHGQVGIVELWFWLHLRVRWVDGRLGRSLVLVERPETRKWSCRRF